MTETDDSDWAVVDAMPTLVTDVIVLNKKEKVPSDFELLETTVDGKKADFAEGRITVTRRYLAFSTKIPSPIRGRVCLTELKVVSSHDKTPYGYCPISHTHDDNVKAFNARQLIAKFTPHEQAIVAITGLVILSPGKKEDTPAGYVRLPEINGFSICYQMSHIKKNSDSPKKEAKEQSHQRPALGDLGKQTSTLAKRVRAAIDGVPFTLTGEQNVQQYIVQFALGGVNLLTLDDVERQFDFDWSQFHNVVDGRSQRR